MYQKINFKNIVLLMFRVSKGTLFIFLCLLSARSFSQPTFTSIDSLLSKTYSAVNLKDSAMYVSLLNMPQLYADKKCKSKTDSLIVLKTFTTSFKNVINELEEVSGTSDFTVVLESFENMHQRKIDVRQREKIYVNVKLLINNKFTLKKLFVVNTFQNTYTIETPLLIGISIE
jgi:hypothetical protein